MKTMKLLFTLTLLLNLSLAIAAPFKNVEKILTQPDGTKLYCYATGDEFYNRLHDADGYTIVQADNGYFVYATNNAQGEIVATEHIAGKSDPKSLGLEPNIVISQKEYLKKRDAMRPAVMRNNSNLNHGQYNNIVVFIKFKGDNDFRTTKTEIDSMFNDNGYYDISMNNYFKKATYNQLSMVSYCYPKADGNKILAYEDIYPRNYYTPYNATSNPDGYVEEDRASREFALLKRAVEYIADEVPDTLNIDRNDDGFVDNIIFVVKGNVGDWSDLLWPHMWSLYGEEAYIHDKQVMTFNFQLETSTYFSVSTLCHEMSHSLGFPDLYHYNEMYDYLSPAGSWDLMCGNSNPPQHTATYSKYKYGTWIKEIPEIGYGTYTIEANSWEGGRRNCYKIPTADKDQYYLVEFRNNSNLFEKGLPNSGLLIYRLDTRFDGCIDFNGHDILDELYIFRPGGSLFENGYINMAAFSEENGRTAFNSETNPYPFLNFIGTDNDINICNISRKGNQMTFSYLPPNDEIIPTNLTANVVKNSHVELKWECAENVKSYNIYRDNTLIASNITDNFFYDDYQNLEKGNHKYSVTSNYQNEESFYSNEKNVIIGNYCEYIFSMNSSGENGWQGGEIKVSFDNGMEDEYLTIYSGKHEEKSVVVPEGIKMSVSWTSGWDDSECSFTIKNEEKIIYESDKLEEGTLISFKTESNMACIKPQNLTAEISDCYVILNWNSFVENDYYTLMRDNEIIADNITSNSFVDKSINKSGTYHYSVMSKKDNCQSELSDTVNVSIMKYNHDIINTKAYFEEEGIKLEWNVDLNKGGSFNYDNGSYITNVGSSNNLWGIKIPAEQLENYQNAKISAVEIFDAIECNYTFFIYNGTTNNNDLLHTETFNTSMTNEIVRLKLSKELSFDPDKDLWIVAKGSSSDKIIPSCNYTGNPNSCLIKSGNSWKSAIDYNINYSWMIRAHFIMDNDNADELSYNLYCQDSLIASNLKSTSYIDKRDFTEDELCYNVEVLHHDRAIAYSENICISAKDGNCFENINFKHINIFPNPTTDFVNIVAENLRNVRIISTTGNVIFEQNLNSNSLKIDMGKYGCGLYLIQITTDKESKIHKVVVH